MSDVLVINVDDSESDADWIKGEPIDVPEDAVMQFAPGLRPTLKHLDGQHDQKTHNPHKGRSSSLPEGWSYMSGKGLNPAIPSTYSGPNNTNITVFDYSNSLVQSSVTPEHMKDVVATVDLLQRIAPIGGLEIEIGEKKFNEVGLPENAHGFVKMNFEVPDSSGNKMWLRNSTVSENGTDTSGTTMRVYDAAAGKKSPAYTIVHEYGHLLDKRSAANSDLDYVEVVSKHTTGMSKYAYSGDPDDAPGREAFAEAWVGWVGSQGRLAEPFRGRTTFVGYFADKYGWDAGNTSQFPSAGFAKELSGDVYIVDTFTDEGAYLIPVNSEDVVSQLTVKHLGGQHDQKTHGRRDAASLPDGWSETSKQDIEGRLRYEYGKLYPRNPERANTIAAETAAITSEYSGPNNTKINIEWDGTVDDGRLNNALSEISRLQGQFPVKDLQVNFGERSFRDEFGIQADDGPKGFVSRGEKVINLRPEFLESGTKVMDAAEGHFMPVSKNVSELSYAITHEYGHVRDRRNPATASFDTGMNATISDYGRVNPFEAYAEAFTEFSLTNGATQNSSARYYADRYFWREDLEYRSVQKAESEESLDNVIIVDTFSDKQPPTVVSREAVFKFAPGLRPVLKHLAGEHDQKTHGAWAGQSQLPGMEIARDGSGPYAEWGDRAREIAVAERTGMSGQELESILLEDAEFDDVDVVEKFSEVFDTYHTFQMKDGTEASIQSNVTMAREFGGDGSEDGYGRRGRLIEVRGELMTEDGAGVGTFHRSFMADDYGNIVVNHEYLSVHEDYQGYGFAKQFNRQAENYYISHGIEMVHVNAAMDGGGYAWASSGFDWDYRHHAESMENITDRLDDYLSQKSDLPSSLRRDIGRIYDRLGTLSVTDSDYPTPKEIAELGMAPGAKNWAGKEILRGSNWYGTKFLSPDGPRVSDSQRAAASRRAAQAAYEAERAAYRAERAPGRGQYTMDSDFLEGALASAQGRTIPLFPPIPGVVGSGETESGQVAKGAERAPGRGQYTIGSPPPRRKGVVHVDRQEELNRTGLVHEAWADKYAAVPGFDPDNPTAEQATDLYYALKSEFGSVGKGEFADEIARMSEDELNQLRRLSIYQ